MSKSSKHWYPRYTGDYSQKTKHLSMIEHGAYVMLMDFYYSNEYLPSSDTSCDLSNDDVLMRICCALDEKERDAVRNVVSQFFTWTEDGYINKRVEEELQKRRDISDKRKKAVDAREKKRKQKDKKIGSSGTSNDTSCDDTSTPTPTDISLPKGKESSPRVIDVPNFIDGDVWMEWVQYRKEKKKTLTPSTIDKQIKQLTKWHNEGQDVKQIINQSIMNGWTGLFKIKEGDENGRKLTKAERADQELRDFMDR